ncbi:MAG TPA: precorrin-3B C(17)-methyltransferase [Thermopetrobacter sp.]|nr:precorrin-3B C(17)-methyltransferase [Thermopetrobacter sp.]
MPAIPCIITLDAASEALARRLARELKAEPRLKPEQPLAAMREAFAARRPLIAICASGIVIRALAPLLADKRAEPPVIAISPDGAHVVALLGGHHGANTLAKRIALITGGIAAVTTASDTRFGLALDDPPPGYRLANPDHVKAFTARLLAGEQVRIEGEHAEWLKNSRLPIAGDGALAITVTTAAISGGADHLVCHPATLCLGVGTVQGADFKELWQLVETTCKHHDLSPAAIAAIATHELKGAEPAILALAEHLDAPLRLFAADELAAVEAPNPSAHPQRAVGTPSVAEAAALLLAGEDGELIVEKHKSARATCAIARAARLVDPAGLPGRAPGRLWVVGIGPGDAASRTQAATHALLAADDWVGYAPYLELIADLHHGQALHPYPIGQEEERVRHALDLAAQGRRVALVCSGDAAIYAMAALVFEVLERTPQRVRIDVLPGVSAFQAASAAAGALIGHDFCAISLSDLLTPWEVIWRRIKTAAAGGFVTAFYNPRSEGRPRHLAKALALFRRHRGDDAPVVVARDLGRAGESVRLTTLGEFDPRTVDMRTLVLVGNRESRIIDTAAGPAAYTPRGYAMKSNREGAS